MPYGAPYRRRARNVRRRPAGRAPARRKAPVKKAIRAVTTKRFNMRVGRALRSMNVLERKIKVSTMATQQPKGFGLQTAADGSSTTRGALFLNVLSQVPLVRGSTQEQINGNEIGQARLRFSGMIVSNPYNSTTNSSTLPYEVWAIAYKVKPAYSNPVKGVPNTIKSYPGNVTGRISGEAYTTAYPWNRDGYTIKMVKRFLMRARPKEMNDGDSVTNPQTSDYPVFKRIGFELPIANTLKYNDGVQVPANEYLTFGFYVIDGGGTDFGAASQLRCTIEGAFTLSWVDA